MVRILFIHGLASSGKYKMADTLRILLKPCEVISPDMPIEPEKAAALLKKICDEQNPDIVIGLSLGGFWAQKLRGYPKVLVNPDLNVSRFLTQRIGTMEYLSPREDGATTFEITKEICEDYHKLELTEFDDLSREEIEMTLGFFADNDELVNSQDVFLDHYYGRGISYPGKHLPTFPEIKNYMIPSIKKLISEFIYPY